jgi:nucleoside-diphosphate-sugar epimerase
VPRILVTGAGGFIGRALCPALASRGHRVLAALRRTSAYAAGTAPGVEARLLGNTLSEGWHEALRQTDIVVHLAQRAHAPSGERVLAEDVRVAGALAREATAAGVKRLIYLSSIKAMGDATQPGRPFRAGDIPEPEDAYGRAKLASEQALREVAAATGLELVVIRPPLVYGPGVGANFRALAVAARSGIPLPFAGIDNRRSLLFRDNLVDLLTIAAVHPGAAAAPAWLACDGHDYSTPALVTALAAALDRTTHLFALPSGVIAALRGLPKIGPPVARLTQSLQVDDSATREMLGWTPPVAAETGLAQTAWALARS